MKKSDAPFTIKRSAAVQPAWSVNPARAYGFENGVAFTIKRSGAVNPTATIKLSPKRASRSSTTPTKKSSPSPHKSKPAMPVSALKSSPRPIVKRAASSTKRSPVSQPYGQVIQKPSHVRRVSPTTKLSPPQPTARRLNFNDMPFTIKRSAAVKPASPPVVRVSPTKLSPPPQRVSVATVAKRTSSPSPPHKAKPKSPTVTREMRRKMELENRDLDAALLVPIADSQRVYLGKSRLGGIGVFAKKFIPAGTRITNYEGEWIQPTFGEGRHKGIMHTHVLSLSAMDALDGIRYPEAGRGVGSLINSSLGTGIKPNARFITINRVTKKGAYARATRDIQPDEEILIQYNYI